MHLQENSLFYLDFGVNFTRNVAQCPLHHVTLATKFEVATSNGFGGDTFTRTVTDGRTDGRTDRETDTHTDGWTTDRLGTKLIYPFFLKKKRV